MSDNAIEMRNFSFRYQDAKRYSARHLNLSIPEGSICCLIGSNGSGKTTLCNAVVGLIPHHFPGQCHGEVKVFGTDVANESIANISKSVGFVFQDPYSQLSYTSSTVAGELAYGLCNRGVPREQMIQRIREVARAVRIEECLDRNPLELSGGQVQRVALGSVLALRPRMLVLDECTTQLDPLGAEEIMDIVVNLNKGGMTVLMADHDMERVGSMADYVVALEDGSVVAQGSPKEVFCQAGLEQHGVAVSDYVRIGEGLRSKGLWDGDAVLDERGAVSCVREALSL